MNGERKEEEGTDGTDLKYNIEKWEERKWSGTQIVETTEFTPFSVFYLQLLR